MRILLLLAAALPALADDDGAKVYKQVVPSSVWIHAKHDRGTATGSGTLIDAERRLVLTNYHVVQETPRVNLYFPALRDGTPIAEKQYYTDRAKSLALGAKVIAKDKKTDLAIIQLDSLPKGKVAVPLAAASAEPGQTVHSIGNTGKSGALWGYVPGKVRQVYQKEWKADLGGGHIANFKAKVVETDSATNPGDSGGPLVSEKGELVAVTEGGAVNAQLLSTFVDVSEVKKLLATPEVKAIKGAVKPREKAPFVVDGAKIFSAETIRKAQAIVNELHAKHKFDVLVETFAQAPADDLDRVKKMNRDDRAAYMKAWVKKRMAAENVNGFGILICNDPKSFFVEATNEAASHFPADVPKAIVDGVMNGLKDKKADESLIKALEKLRDTYGTK